MAREQGVLQVWPVEVLASAPAGSDSSDTVSVGGAGFMESSHDDVEEQPARTRLPPRIAITRYIFYIPSARMTALGHPPNATIGRQGESRNAGKPLTLPR